jgi:hypothetical protein
VRNPLQEPDRVPGRKISGYIVGVVAATLAGVFIAVWIGSCRAHEIDTVLVWPPTPAVPGEVNAMETRPFVVQAQGLEWNAANSDWLASYGWVDRARGIVHVPVDVAIDLYLARQRQAQPQPQPQPAEPRPQLGQPQEKPGPGGHP